ncbi:MAG: ribose 5-phosphate isomerase B [Phycisphaerae bacterium]|nr:ribose 5-phosphate isomerase B [Phycisphaerae bacterium]
MRVALSCDHRGAHLYDALANLLTGDGHELVSGILSCDGDPCDYPDMAYSVCRAVVDGEADTGMLVCGSGIGMSIAANKFPGVRAALVHDDITAEVSRRHNDANVLCLSADLLGQPLIEKIAQIWLATEFEGGRHTRRLKKISAIEAGQDPSAVAN